MTKTETIKKTRDAEATKKRILDAAKHEFAQNGFDGARVDKIANLAQINKQMLYHYFGNKDELFKLVLEEAYRSLREYESCVDMNHLPANEAILALIEFTWSHYLEHPELISLLTVENQMEAKHLKKNRSIKKINEHHINSMKALLERGQKEGNIRVGIDPMQINISIAALGFFYLINQHTLSQVYQCNLVSKKALNERLRVIKEIIACWISPS